MKPSTLVHIGYHKTATNWFQRLYYPAVRNFHYVHRKRVRLALLEDHAFAFDPAVARTRLDAPPEIERLILCEEELSGNFHSGGLYGFLAKEVAHRIKATLPEAQIVIFIRSQPEMISSAYKQYIKEGGTHSPQRYLFPYEHLDPHGFSPKKIPLFTFQHFDYRPLIQHYRQVFGATQVHVFLYEEFARNQQTFMAAYATRFGFEVDLQALTDTRLNVSNRLLGLWGARLLNHFSNLSVMDKRCIVHIPGMYRLRRYGIAPLLDRIPYISGPANTKSVLGPAILRHINDFYRESNRALADELNLPLAEYGYPM